MKKIESRAELLKNKGYQTAKIQLELFREIELFMKEKNMNKSQLAEYLECSKGYVSQLLNGDFDHKLSKLVELSLAIGKIPEIKFVTFQDYIYKEEKAYSTQISFEQSYSFKYNSPLKKKKEKEKIRKEEYTIILA